MLSLSVAEKRLIFGAAVEHDEEGINQERYPEAQFSILQR
jgi:hypothetical protein